MNDGYLVKYRGKMAVIDEVTLKRRLVRENEDIDFIPLSMFPTSMSKKDLPLVTFIRSIGKDSKSRRLAILYKELKCMLVLDQYLDGLFEICGSVGNIPGFNSREGCIVEYIYKSSSGIYETILGWHLLSDYVAVKFRLKNNSDDVIWKYKYKTEWYWGGIFRPISARQALLCPR